MPASTTPAPPAGFKGLDERGAEARRLSVRYAPEPDDGELPEEVDDAAPAGSVLPAVKFSSLLTGVMSWTEAAVAAEIFAMDMRTKASLGYTFVRVDGLAVLYEPPSGLENGTPLEWDYPSCFPGGGEADAGGELADHEAVDGLADEHSDRRLPASQPEEPAQPRVGRHRRVSAT